MTQGCTSEVSGVSELGQLAEYCSFTIFQKGRTRRDKAGVHGRSPSDGRNKNIST